jgi:hypothetical protein
MARFHDPNYQVAALVEDLAGRLIEVLRNIKLYQGIARKEELMRTAVDFERHCLSVARERYGWKERELPIQVTFDYVNGKAHADIRGPIATEVAAKISMLIGPNQGLVPVTFSAPADPELEDPSEESVDESPPSDQNPGFRYGRR